MLLQLAREGWHFASQNVAKIAMFAPNRETDLAITHDSMHLDVTEGRRLQPNMHLGLLGPSQNPGLVDNACVRDGERGTVGCRRVKISAQLGWTASGCSSVSRNVGRCNW